MKSFCFSHFTVYFNTCTEYYTCRNKYQLWPINEFRWFKKHCQRHNGPEGWVLITKVSYLGHITSSQTNLDQISSSKSWPNIASESRPRIIFIIATKGQQQNIDLTSASKSFAKILRAKSGQKFVFMTKLQLLSINTSNSNNLNKFWVGIFTSQGHINQVY